MRTRSTKTSARIARLGAQVEALEAEFARNDERIAELRDSNSGKATGEFWTLKERQRAINDELRAVEDELYDRR